MSIGKRLSHRFILILSLSVILSSCVSAPPDVQKGIIESELKGTNQSTAYDHKQALPNPAPVTWYVSSSAPGRQDIDIDGDGKIDAERINVRSDFRKLNNNDNRIGGMPNIKPGDRILLKRGDVFTSPLLLDYRGLPEQPIVIGSWGDGDLPNPVIRLNDPEDPRWAAAELSPEDLVKGGDIAIQLLNPDHIVIRNIDVENAFTGVYIRYDDMRTHFNITIEGMNFRNLRSSRIDEWSYAWERQFERAFPSGIMVGGRNWKFHETPVLDGLTVKNNSFINCGTGLAVGYWHQDWADYDYKVNNLLMENNIAENCESGFMYLNYIDEGVIRNNEAYGSGGTASSGVSGGFVEFSRSLIIEGNAFIGTRRKNLITDSRTIYTWDGYGFDFEGANYDMEFRNNLLAFNDGGGLLLCAPKNGEPQTIDIRGNIFLANLNSPDMASRKEAGIPILDTYYEIFSDFFGGSSVNARGVMEDNRIFLLPETEEIRLPTAGDDLVFTPGAFSPAALEGYSFQGNQVLSYDSSKNYDIKELLNELRNNN